MAKKFKLQSVLNYRQSLENQAQQVLTTSLQRRSELEDELQRQRALFQQHDAALTARQRDGLTIAEMELFEIPIQHCRRLIAQFQQELAQLDRQIVGEREELLGMARDRQVMEKLKDKQEAEYRKELSRKEREILDEISLRSKGDLR